MHDYLAFGCFMSDSGKGCVYVCGGYDMVQGIFSVLSRDSMK